MESANTVKQLETKLLRSVGQAIEQFNLIEAGDRILVGLSGGKDSYGLLNLLLLLQQRAPIQFELHAVNLDPGYAGYRPEVVKAFADQHGVVIHMLNAPIEALVQEKLKPGQAACPLCSRIRRGSFYSLAQKIGFNKLALGHHFDDAAETLLMNMFYAGSMRAMPPLLKRPESPSVIRPLCLVLERDLSTYAQTMNFPVIPCASPHCGAADRRRQVIKTMLNTLEADHGDVKNQLRKAMTNIDPRFLFDQRLMQLAPQSDIQTPMTDE